METDPTFKQYSKHVRGTCQVRRQSLISAGQKINRKEDRKCTEWSCGLICGFPLNVCFYFGHLKMF